VKLAEFACKKTNWKDSQYLDTLAAANAEVEIKERMPENNET
jgi:hypothetical protein